MRRIVVGALSLAVAAAGCAGGGTAQESGGGPEEVVVVRTRAVEPRAESAEDAAVEALEHGRMLEKKGDLANAEELYLSALKRPDVGTKHRAELHLRVARLRAEADRPEDALEHAAAAQRLRPDWDDAAAFRRKMEHRLGKGAPGGKEGGGPGTYAKEQDRDSTEERLERLEAHVEKISKHLEGAGGAAAGKDRSAGMEKEMVALREKLDQARRSSNELEGQRHDLKRRVAALEEECAALRKECEKLRAAAAK